jgi:Zn ribbon nucleic-acid-binding protein
MDYTNCPECSAPTHSTTWEAFDGSEDGACWCQACGWNDRSSAAFRRRIQKKNAQNGAA